MKWKVKRRQKKLFLSSLSHTIIKNANLHLNKIHNKKFKNFLSNEILDTSPKLININLTYRHGALQSVSTVQQVSDQLLCHWKMRRQLRTSLHWIRIATVQKLGTTEAILFPVIRCLGYVTNKGSECLNYGEHQKYDCLSTTEENFYGVISPWLFSINLLALNVKMAKRKISKALQEARFVCWNCSHICKSWTGLLSYIKGPTQATVRLIHGLLKVVRRLLLSLYHGGRSLNVDE